MFSTFENWWQKINHNLLGKKHPVCVTVQISNIFTCVPLLYIVHYLPFLLARSLRRLQLFSTTVLWSSIHDICCNYFFLV